MIPWHLVRYTVEEEEAIVQRLRRMHQRLDMPTEIVETDSGFTASRDGNVGRGSTAEEAKSHLWDIENGDVINPILPDGTRQFALNLPKDRMNIPWHTIRRTPEEEADVMRRLHQMDRRLDMPTEIVPTEDGYVARRDGNAGRGATPEEARQDLWEREHQDVLFPPTRLSA